MLAEDFIFGLGVAIIAAKGTRELTIGIVGAADKGAKFTKFEREYSVFTACAFSRVRAIFFVWENLRAERVIERIEYIGNAQFLCLINGCLLYTSDAADE